LGNLNDQGAPAPGAREIAECALLTLVDRALQQPQSMRRAVHLAISRLADLARCCAPVEELRVFAPLQQISDPFRSRAQAALFFQIATIWLKGSRKPLIELGSPTASTHDTKGATRARVQGCTQRREVYT
jgi:hypothetical protein